MGSTPGGLDGYLGDLLVALGVEDPEALSNTPRRWASWLSSFGNHKRLTPTAILRPIFPIENGELVLVKDILYTAMCLHHALPFRGKAAVGYIPDDGVVGLSKLPRLVQFYADNFTLQEIITSRVADAIQEVLHPKGAMVVLYASEHQCMSVRGIKDTHARTVTSAVRGVFRTNDAGCKDEFLQLIRL